MFEELKDLYNQIAEFDNRNPIGDYDVAEYIELVSEFVTLGEEYYEVEDIEFDDLLLMVEKEMAEYERKSKKVNRIDHYDRKDALAWIAGYIVDGTHYGDALTEEELDYRIELHKDYLDEVAFAKILIANNPVYEAMSYKEKINFIANVMVELRARRKDLNQEKGRK